jgi:16S rRNA processing protein RimM
MGRVLGPYGVRGWIKLRTFTEHPDSLVDYERWLIAEGDGWRAMDVEETHLHSGQLVVKLAGVDDRDQALALRGREVAVPRADLPPAGEGEFYWADLIGLAVVNVQGEILGKVEDLLETGANDVLVVKGDTQHLLPYVDAVVLDVDLEAGRIQVDWGLDF